MPFTLPDHVDVSLETLREIAERHGLGGSSVERLPEAGIFNAIYRLGDGALLRIPRNHPKFVQAAHREVATLDGDATAEARILWRHLQLGIWTLPRGASPGRSWAERPLPMLLETLRFFLEPPDERCAALGPAKGGQHVEA